MNDEFATYESRYLERLAAEWFGDQADDDEREWELEDQDQ
jgi:hypothetical protein